MENCSTDKGGNSDWKKEREEARLMVSMAEPSWYSWPEFDRETDALRPDASPEVVKKYERARKRWQREQLKMWKEELENSFGDGRHYHDVWNLAL
ncbi:hypothetical protein GC093_15360 [Paenibacillus sp. LMG 31456]|uniref:Uncharacterized protein n=1 Tax=Paenibacillus foliorum TaxID=2654974 RepID=A0A972GPT3_9BACL|nr:hypothetical protein [Paenibacillus foliorum]NOU94587.1 hypothetical protein [Paenibacillus foliorum]